MLIDVLMKMFMLGRLVTINCDHKYVVIRVDPTVL